MVEGKYVRARLRLTEHHKLGLLRTPSSRGLLRGAVVGYYTGDLRPTPDTARAKTTQT